MIQPEAYYAAHKEAPDPLTLGRVGFALVGRGDELNPPLNAAERWIISTILRCNKWHNEKRDEVKEKWKKDKQRQRVSAGQEECPPMSNGQTNVHQCPPMSTNVHQRPTDNGVSTTSINLPTDLSNYLPNSLTNINRTDADTDRGCRGNSASGRLNVFKMDEWEFFSGEHSTLEMMTSALGKGFWAKAIRQLGDGVCLEELWSFVSEVRAGESVNNPGAVMTERLKARGVK